MFAKDNLRIKRLKRIHAQLLNAFISETPLRHISARSDNKSIDRILGYAFFSRNALYDEDPRKTEIAGHLWKVFHHIVYLGEYCWDPWKLKLSRNVWHGVLVDRGSTSERNYARMTLFHEMAELLAMEFNLGNWDTDWLELLYEKSPFQGKKDIVIPEDIFFNFFTRNQFRKKNLSNSQMALFSKKSTDPLARHFRCAGSTAIYSSLLRMR